MGTNMGRNGGNANNPMISTIRRGWDIRHPLDQLGVVAGLRGALGEDHLQGLDATLQLFVRHPLDATSVGHFKLARHHTNRKN